MADNFTDVKMEPDFENATDNFDPILEPKEEEDDDEAEEEEEFTVCIVSKPIPNASVGKFQCEICDRSFGMKNELTVHMKKNFTCLICSETFQYESALAIHCMKSHSTNAGSERETILKPTGSAAVGKFQCELCDRSFSMKCHLSNHMRCHFICTVCDQHFKSETMLVHHHMKSHDKKVDSGELLACAVCGGMFMSRAALKTHMAIHQGPDSFDDDGAVNVSIKVKDEEDSLAWINEDDDCSLCDLVEDDNAGLPVCGICDVKFQDKDEFKKHMEGHENPNKCKICGEVFAFKSELSEHFQACSQAHLKKSSTLDARYLNKMLKPYKCDTCGRTFATQSTLSTHQITHGGCKYCPVCGKGFLQQKELFQHIADRHPGGADPSCLTCSKCGQTFSEQHELFQHVLKKHPKGTSPFKPIQTDLHKKISMCDTAYMSKILKPYKCDSCGRAFATESTLSAHQVAHNCRKFCAVCGKGFSQQHELFQHIVENHPKGAGIKTVPCIICNKSFTKEFLDEHTAQVHGTDGPFKCKKCDQAFREKDHLTEHTKTRHYTCITCDEQFKSERLLTLHHMEFHAQPVFSCSICGRSFPKQDFLDEHVLTHAGTKQFTCTICNKSTWTKDRLDHHKGFHYEVCGKSPYIIVKSPSGETEYKCGLCRMAYDTAADVEEHMEAHHHKFAKMGRYRCRTCNQMFISESLVEEHILQNHEDKPFRCPVCGTQFVTKIGLNAHIKIHSRMMLGDPKTKKKFQQSITTYSCTECFKIFKKEQSLIEHVMEDHSPEYTKRKKYNNSKKTFQCTKCKVSFEMEETLTMHMIDRHSDEKTPYPCSDCCLIFLTKMELTKHMVEDHREGDAPQHPCRMCDKKFESIIEMGRHVVNEHIEETDSLKSNKGRPRTFNADMYRVDVGQETKSALTKIMVEDPREDDKHPCTMCDKVFKTKIEMGRHVVKEHVKKPGAHKLRRLLPKPCDSTLRKVQADTGHVSVCQFPRCSRKFASESGLARHMKDVHNLYRCKFCPMKFKTEAKAQKHSSKHKTSNLVKHEPSYDGKAQDDSRIFKCTLCAISCPDREELVSHVRKNHNRQPCEICNKIFKSLSEVIKHRAVHRNLDGTYKCDRCSEPFQSWQNLSDHLLTAHINESRIKCEIGDEQSLVEPDINPESDVDVPFAFEAESGMEISDVAESCDLCAMGFLTAEDLKQHIENAHSSDTLVKPIVILPESEDLTNE